MILVFTTDVTLDPVKDYEVVRKYEEDPDWRKAGEGTLSVVFERKTELNLDAFYLTSREEEE